MEDRADHPLTLAWRNPRDLRPHPRNALIYGPPDADLDDLIESIREHGIRQTVRVDQHDTIVSGHRRVAAAVALDLTAILVEVEQHADDDALLRALLESNAEMRKKPLRTILHEARIYDAIFKRDARWRMGHHRSPDDDPDTEGPRRNRVARKVGLSSGSYWQDLAYIFDTAEAPEGWSAPGELRHVAQSYIHLVEERALNPSAARHEFGVQVIRWYHDQDDPDARADGDEGFAAWLKRYRPRQTRITKLAQPSPAEPPQGSPPPPSPQATESAKKWVGFIEDVKNKHIDLGGVPRPTQAHHPGTPPPAPPDADAGTGPDAAADGATTVGDPDGADLAPGRQLGAALTACQQALPTERAVRGCRGDLSAEMRDSLTRQINRHIDRLHRLRDALGG